MKTGRAIGEPPKAAYLRVVGAILHAMTQDPGLLSFLRPSAVLVPVPSSSMKKPDSLWVPEQIALALVQTGLGSRVARLLERTESIGKAAWSQSSERPTPLRHYETLAVQKDLLQVSEILVVDDIVTSGSALLGSANRLHDAYPDVPIKGFAAIRTITDPIDFTVMQSPTVGTITMWPNGKGRRVP